MKSDQSFTSDMESLPVEHDVFDSPLLQANQLHFHLEEPIELELDFDLPRVGGGGRDSCTSGNPVAGGRCQWSDLDVGSEQLSIPDNYSCLGGTFSHLGFAERNLEELLLRLHSGPVHHDDAQISKCVSNGTTQASSLLTAETLTAINQRLLMSILMNRRELELIRNSQTTNSLHRSIEATNLFGTNIPTMTDRLTHIEPQEGQSWVSSQHLYTLLDEHRRQQQLSVINSFFTNADSTSSSDKSSRPECTVSMDGDALPSTARAGKKRDKVNGDEREKSPKRKKPRKKPTGMPRRPLSAYNIFFSAERVRILESLDPDTIAAAPIPDYASKVKGRPDSPELPEAMVRPLVLSDADKRPHRKLHGKIGFRELAKLVGQRWKQLTPERKKYYQDLAKQDLFRHKRAMEEYYKKEAANVHEKQVFDKEEEDKKGSADVSHAENQRGCNIVIEHRKLVDGSSEDIAPASESDQRIITREIPCCKSVVHKLDEEAKLSRSIDEETERGNKSADAGRNELDDDGTLNTTFDNDVYATDDEEEAVTSNDQRGEFRKVNDSDGTLNTTYDNEEEVASKDLNCGRRPVDDDGTLNTTYDNDVYSSDDEEKEGPKTMLERNRAFDEQSLNTTVDNDVYASDDEGEEGKLCLKVMHTVGNFLGPNCN